MKGNNGFVMAIDYYLTIRNEDRTINSSDVQAVIVSAFALSVDRMSGILSTTGAAVSIFPEERGRAEAEGVRCAGVCVAFRIDKFGDRNVGISQMLQMVALVLREFDGDAVLVFDSDEVVLRRVRGELALSDEGDFWTPEHKEIFASLWPVPVGG